MEALHVGRCTRKNMVEEKVSPVIWNLGKL
jgi:hypothetical protein